MNKNFYKIVIYNFIFLYFHTLSEEGRGKFAEDAVSLFFHVEKFFHLKKKSPHNLSGIFYRKSYHNLIHCFPGRGLGVSSDDPYYCCTTIHYNHLGKSWLPFSPSSGSNDQKYRLSKFW